MAKSISEMLEEERKKRDEEERKRQEEANRILESLHNKNDQTAEEDNSLGGWIEGNKEQNVGGFGGGLQYVGQRFLNDIVSSAEGLVDYTVGGLAKLFGGRAGEKYAEDLMENTWYDYEAADRKYNPNWLMKGVGDVAGGLGQGVFSIGTGALVTLATGGAGLAPTIAKGIGVAADVGIDYLSSAGRAVASAVQDEDADNKGLTDDKWLGGSLSGFMEASLGQIVPAAGKLGNKVLGETSYEMGSEITESLTKRIVNGIRNGGAGKQILGEMAGEGIEGALSAIIEPYIIRATYDKDMQNATVGDVAYSALIEALTGGITSSTVKGIETTVNAVTNTKRGNEIASDTKKLNGLLQNAEIISSYESERHTGSSVFEAVVEQYNKVMTSLESTGGVAATLDQKKMLGELDAYVAQAVLQPTLVESAKNVVYNADAYAESLNNFYKRTGTDTVVTAADLTAGLDTSGDSRSFVKSVSTALKNNGALRGVVLNNALGQMEMDTRAYANSIYGGTSISAVASQDNINRFVETADEDTIKSVEATLGVDMRTVTPEILAESIIRWRDSGAAAVYEGGFRDVQDAVNTLEFIDDLPSEYDLSPKELESIMAGGSVQTSRIKEGVTRFTHGDTDIAIIKHGDEYRIYDYKSGKVSRVLTHSELSGIVRQLRSGGKTIEVIGRVAEGARFGADTQNIDAMALESIPEYKNLNESEKLTIRETLRRAIANGVSSEDAVLFGKISAKSGMNIVALNDADYRHQLGEGSDAMFDGRNTVYVNADADRSSVFSGLLGHEMWHRIFMSRRGKKLFMTAYNEMPEDKRAEVEKRYADEMGELGYGEETSKKIAREEVAAAYAEELFNNPEVWEYVLSEEPSLKDRVISFFKGANKKYSFEPGMTAAAKKWLKEYKRLFNEVSAYNKGANAAQNAVASEGVKKIKKLGRVVESGESAEFRVQNAELNLDYDGKNSQKSTLTNINKENMHVSDSGERYSYSSIAYSFFGDKTVKTEDFESGSYKSTEGYKKYVDQCLSNVRQTSGRFNESKARKEIESSIDGIVRVAVAMKKAGYDILDNRAKRETKDSKNRLLFSSLEPNSDYFTSSDISTICDKRINFAQIYDDIVRKEESLGVPTDKRFFNNVDNYFVIHKIMADKGLTQPCRQCYVESMRKNLAPMAKAFLKLVQETNPNNTANDQLFSKGKPKPNNTKLRESLLKTIETEEYDITADKLTVEMLTTEDGLAQLKLQAPLIYEAFNSFYGQSKPKMPKSATPFRFGELTALLTDDNGNIKTGLIKQIKSTGGFRLQSYSNFQIQNYVDVLQVIFEAGTLGLPGHAYTKVPAFLDATKGTNLKRNISIFMYNDNGEWRIDKNDSFPYDLDRIYDIVNDDKQGNTSVIAVVQNEVMAAYVMANDNIGYFIPFHKSGMKMDTVRDTVVKEGGREIKGYSGIKDHTRQQTEVWAKTTSEHKAYTKVTKGIDIYEFWDFNNADNLSKEGLIEKNVKRYIDACEKAGYLPKFREYLTNNSKILSNVLSYAKELGFVSQNATVGDISFEYKGYKIPYGYYKCLGDYGMFKPNGEAAPAKVLSLKNYNFDEAVKYFENSETLRRNEILQQIANGEERERYRNSNMTTAEIAEKIQIKRGEVVDSVIKRKTADDGVRRALKKDDAAYRDKVNARAEAKIAKATEKAETKAERAIETKTAQLKAEYTTDTVFSQNSVKSGFDSVAEVKNLPAKVREEIARDLWLELEASDDADVRDTFIIKYSVKLYDAIRQDSFETFDNMTMKEKDALRVKLNEAVKKIVESGKKSKWAKQKDNVRGIVKLEEQVASEIKSKIYQSLKKIEDVKKERFLAASAYKSDEFKGTLENLTKIDWRGKFSSNIARDEVKKLSSWYSEENPMFKPDDDQVLKSNNGFSQSVKNMLDMLAEGEGDFSNKELLALSDVINYFSDLISNYDKVYLEGKWVSGEDLVYEIKATLDKQSKIIIPASTRRLRSEIMGQETFGDPLSVMKLADMYENGIFTRYYNEWQAGEIASAAEQARLEEKYNDFFSKKENKHYLENAMKETVNLHGVEVRKIDYIEYCMTLKREQAFEGVESGGVLVQRATKKGDGENVKIYPISEINKGRGYKQSLESAVKAEYDRAVKLLSQKDLEYMRILEKGYELAREVKALGDVQRQGFASVVEGYYYPIRRAYSEHLSEFDAASFATDKYANAGFNKRQIADSNGALKIGSADDTFHRHIRGVSGYLHLSPVMDSFNKVYKLKVLKTRPGIAADGDYINILKSGRNTTTSLQQMIDQSKNTWRDKNGKNVGFEYLQELMLDTMGKVPSGKLDEYAAKLRGGYVKFALGGNPKVLLTQLSSLMASTSVISKRSHVMGILNSTAKVDDYSTVARLRYGDNTVLKAQGVIDTVNSKTDVFMKGIELFDRFVVKRAFAACQAEVAKTQGFKVGTEENLKAAGKLLDKVILETQQNSFASSKTAAARRGGALAKTLQMFKSDAVKITARILDAWGERAYIQKMLDTETDGSKTADLKARLKEVNKRLRDAIDAAVMQAIYMGAVAELFRALYGKIEDDEEFLEKAKRLGAEFLGNLLGGLPMWAEAYSALTSKFGNLEAMEFSALNDLISTVNKIINTAGDALQGKADFKDYTKMFESSLYSLGQIFGIPFRNLKNVASISLNFLSKDARYRWDDLFENKNYGTDLENAVAVGDLNLALTIIELAFNDRLGSGLSKEAIKELSRLTGVRDDILPSAVGDTITVDGEERELTASEMNAIRDRYSDAVEQINKFIEGDFYDNLSDEDRAAAIKKIYTLYKELAIDTVLGTEKDKKAMILSKVVPAESLVLWEVAKVIDSDKDEDGNTVYGSKKKNLIEAIMAEQLSYEEKLLLIGMSDLTLNGGDIEGVTGYEARVALYNYISNLEGISDKERDALLEYCGFKDKDGNGSIDEPLPSDINNSYKSDLKDAVENGDTKSAEDIISLAVRENLGVDISKEAVKEIARLAATGKNVLPSVIEDSVKIGGKERELTAAEYKAAMKKYSVAAAEVDKLIKSDIYKSLNDDQKASALKSVFDMFKNIAYDTTLGTDKDKKAVVLSKVVDTSTLVIWDVAGAIDSDRDENGYTIDGSRKENVINAIWGEKLSYEEKLLLIGANGYKINGGDLGDVTGYEARMDLYEYISDLDGIEEHERLELYKYCGFVDESGNVREPLQADVETTYEKDLKAAIESDNAKRAVEIISLAMRESFGKNVDNDTIGELLRLTVMGKDVLTSAISNKISINGKTRELTVEEYKAVFEKSSIASSEIQKFIKSDVYKTLNDDQRASVVNSVYDMFKDIAYDTTIGTSKNSKATALSKIVDTEALVLWKTVSVYEADKDENGKSISGSKKAKIVNAIWSSGYTDEEKLLLIGMNGYKVDDDDIPGVTGYQAQMALYNYIASLEGITEEERLTIYKECGYTIENGVAVEPTEKSSSSSSSSSSKKTSGSTVKRIGWKLGGGTMVGSLIGKDYTKKIVKLGKARIK